MCTSSELVLDPPSGRAQFACLPTWALTTSTIFRYLHVSVNSSALDYSKWDRWVQRPDDPVSHQEEEARRAREERERDEAFERANADFCAQVKGDMEKRGQATREKREKCEREWFGTLFVMAPLATPR